MTDAELIEELRTLLKSCDEERLVETREAYVDAEKWQSEGDMYGWNFYQGKASGTVEASIIFYRARRLLEKERPV